MKYFLSEEFPAALLLGDQLKILATDSQITEEQPIKQPNSHSTDCVRHKYVNLRHFLSKKLVRYLAVCCGTVHFKYRFLSILFILFLSSAAEPLYSQTRWSFELQFGVVHSLDLPIRFHQDGFSDIKLSKADFYSEPLNDPPYWDWRFTKWFKNKSIEFEAIHHKFYLKNLPDEVQRFGVSHGYNMCMFNHGRRVGKYILRTGAGSVLVHGESTVRGMVYPVGPGLDIPGYRLRGIALNFAAARQFRVSKTFFMNTEFKINASVANVPIVSGYARVHIVVFQLILGPGFNWAVREE